MRKLLALALLSGLQLCAAWTHIADSTFSAANGGNVTTSSIDSTGANLEYVHVMTYSSMVMTGTLSDSLGNTWVFRASQTYSSGGGYYDGIFSCYPCTVGAGQTFTITRTGGGWEGLVATAWSGFGGTVGSYAGSNATSTTLTPGSVTPAVNGALVVSSFVFFGEAGTATITGGFSTPVCQCSNSLAPEGAVAYLVQATAAAANPTWTMPIGAGNQYLAGMNVVFNPPAAVASSSQGEIF